MQELTPPSRPGRAHTHQIRAQVRKHARSQANKKNKSARSQARQRTHARAGGRKPTPTPMQGGRVERGCTQLTRAVRGGWSN